MLLYTRFVYKSVCKNSMLKVVEIQYINIIITSGSVERPQTKNKEMDEIITRFFCNKACLFLNEIYFTFTYEEERSICLHYVRYQAKTAALWKSNFNTWA